MRTFILLLGMAFSMHGACAEKISYAPPSGFVPDEKTAVQIAVAVWIPIYGKDKIKRKSLTQLF